MNRAGLEHLREQASVSHRLRELLGLSRDDETLGVPAERPQRPGLDAEHADAQRRIGIRSREAQRLVDRLDPPRVVVAHQPVLAECDAQREGVLGKLLLSARSSAACTFSMSASSALRCSLRSRPLVACADPWYSASAR